MGRAALKITKEDLVKVISELETKQTFINQTKLFDAVCATDWAKNMTNTVGDKKPLQPINVYQYTKNLGVTFNTPKGKKGNPNIGSSGKSSKNRSKKMEAKSGYYLALNELKYNFKKRPNLLKSVLKGSITAAVKAKCLDCCCGSVSEAKACTVYGCPLYLISPFTGGANVDVGDNDGVSICLL